MIVKDLESQLKKLSLRRPSPDMDDRVLSQRPERPLQHRRALGGVPLWATAAVAVVMAAGGFVAGVAWRGGRSGARSEERLGVVIHVIYDSRTPGNPFDFTRASHFFPAEEVETVMRTVETAI
jgi:hypothetical protein